MDQQILCKVCGTPLVPAENPSQLNGTLPFQISCDTFLLSKSSYYDILNMSAGMLERSTHAMKYNYFHQSEFENRCPYAMQITDYAKKHAGTDDIRFDKAEKDKYDDIYTVSFTFTGHIICITCTCLPNKPLELSHTIQPLA